MDRRSKPSFIRSPSSAKSSRAPITPSCGSPSSASPIFTRARKTSARSARLLDACSCCDTAEEIIGHIHTIDRLKIKGLGPAVANLLYFLHPTLVPPFNTAIVKGYNALTGANVKLGSWEHFLAMRSGVLDLNDRHRDLLSNDLGAIGGLLFDIGSDRYPAPPLDGSGAALASWGERLEAAREEARTLSKAALREGENERTHTEIQAWLRDLGLALGYDVWIASNDRSRPFNGSPLGHGCLERLPTSIATSKGADSIRLIDVLWLERGGRSCRSGVRGGSTRPQFIQESCGCSTWRSVAATFTRPRGCSSSHPTPARRTFVRKLQRPAFSRVADLDISYLPYSELEKNREAIARFGSGLKAIKAVSSKLA